MIIAFKPKMKPNARKIPKEKQRGFILLKKYENQIIYIKSIYHNNIQ